MKTGNDEQEKGPNAYARFSAMGFQMLGIILVAALGGNYLDNHLGTLKYRVFTIILVLLSLATSMYLLIKELKEKE